jgi:putative resolvase
MGTRDQKPDLDRRVTRLTEWTTARGLPVVRVVSDTGSALNSAPSKLKRLLADPDVLVIVVERRDRLVWFGE